MEVLQMIIVGLLVVVLGIVFVTRIADGARTAGDNVTNAATSAGTELESAVDAIKNEGSGG